MAKEFNPDEFLQDTAPIAEAQADIERRNAERTAAGQPPLTGAAAQPNMAPSGAAVAPVRPGFTEAPVDWTVNNVVAPAYGVAKAAGGVAAEHPLATAYGASYIPGVNKLPGISTIKAGREATSNILSRFTPAAEEVVGSSSRPIGATQPPSIIQRGMDYASKMRQIAADKVVQGANAAKTFATETVVPNASNIAKAGVGAAAMLTPGNIGQNYPFPTKGPYAGMEINPRTGRPWTQQELAQYR